MKPGRTPAAGLSAAFAFAWVAMLTGPAAAEEPVTIPIPSVWELVEVSPVTMFDSNPRGMANHREYYTREGEVCFLEPGESFPESRHCLQVELAPNARSVITPDGERHPSEVLALSEASLSLRFPDDSVLEFRRLDDAAVGAPIRPQSLHVLRVSEGEQLAAREVEYVEASGLDGPRALLGVWEVIGYRNVPYPDLPPYGFPNEKWVFDGTRLVVVPPASAELAEGRAQAYSRTDGELSLSQESASFGVSFDAWGDLLLTTPRGVMRLRQLGRDPQEIPVIPTKVTLLEPAGE